MRLRLPGSASAALPLAAASTIAALFFAGNASAQDAPQPQPLPQPQPYQYQPAPQVQPQPTPAPYPYQGPKEITNYEEGDPVPPGYHAEERSRKGLVIAGSIVFGTLYFFTAVAAGIDADQGDGEAQSLWIPAVGPFLQAAKTDNGGADSLLILDGLGQSAGLFMLIYGLAASRTILVRNDVAKLHVVPMTGRNTSGLMLGGTF
jgi:hypothetical protein